MSRYIYKPTLRSTRIPLLLFRSSLRYYNYRNKGLLGLENDNRLIIRNGLTSEQDYKLRSRRENRELLRLPTNYDDIKSRDIEGAGEVSEEKLEENRY